MTGRYLKYSQFKDSGVEWLRDIPEHWDVKKLKYQAFIQPSNVDKKSKEGEQPVRLCNYTDVYYNDMVDDSMEFMAASASEEQIEKFVLKAGDTIITKDSEDPTDIAIPTYVPRDMPGVVCGYHLAMIRPLDSAFGSFIKRVFEGGYARAYFCTRSNGLTRFGLGTYPLSNFYYPRPPKEEAVQIANFLDHETAKIDTLIAKQQQLIKLLKEKRQAVISHAVTKGLNPNAPMKDSGVEWLEKVPEHWDVKRLGILFSESAHRASTQEELGYPILSVSIHHGISDKELDESELDRKVSRSEDRSLYKVVNENDLAYNMMRAWQGGFGASKLNGLISPAYVVCKPKTDLNSSVVCKPKTDLNSSYFELVLRSPNAVTELKRFSRGITDFRLRLYWDEFKNIRVPIPPAAEVNEILEHINSVNSKYDQIAVSAQKQIDLLLERRTALISAAVTGKIDVRNWKPEQTEARMESTA